MLEDRRLRSTAAAMQIAVLYENQRDAVVRDVSAAPHQLVAAALRAHGIEPDGPSSADLLSEGPDGLRIVEVKGRGGRGPIDLPERQLSTMRLAGRLGWLYVVWNTTQRYPEQLWLINDPARLDWQLQRPATRLKGQPRGVRHEGIWRLDTVDVEAHGTRVL